MFLKDNTIDDILKVVGNVKDESVRTHIDDGHTQQVTARVGVTKVEDVYIPNPVTLQPRRTFLEIEQPASQFVLRLREGIQCALFEAGGGTWKLDAIERIRDFLKKRTSKIAIIA